MLVVMELPVSGNIFVDGDGNKYIQAVVIDDGEKYSVMVNIDLGVAYTKYVVMREPN